MIEVHQQELSLPNSLIYKSFHQPDLFVRWFKVDGHKTLKTENNFEEGGVYTVDLIAQEGTDIHLEGTYLELIENRLISCSWKWVDQQETFIINQVNINIDPIDQNRSKVTISRSPLLDRKFEEYLNKDVEQFVAHHWVENLKNLDKAGQVFLKEGH